MRSKYSIICGIIIVLIGVLFLGNSLSFWDINLFFAGWWTLFIIVPSLLGLFKKETVFASMFFLLIGILLLLACQNIINFSMILRISIPVLIIMIGLVFIFKKNECSKKGTNDNLPEYIGIFGGTENKVADNFKGCSCITVFGGVDLDLSEATITEDIIIECVSVFGGIDIKVPDNVNIKISGAPIFGGVENRSFKKPDVNAFTIYINYVCVFAGIELK